MQQIERLIQLKLDENLGDIYIFGERHRDIGVTQYLSLENAREARRIYDQSKPHWTGFGKDSRTDISGEICKPTTVIRDISTNQWYCQVKLEDDILVSDLYPKREIQRIKKYLESNKWSIQALNALKREGYEGSGKYYGIVPLKHGYCIMDYNHKKYGVFELLEEAVQARDILLKKGVVL